MFSKNISKRILFFTIIITLLPVIDYFFGIKVYFFVMATFFLGMAITFTIKKEYCIKYFSFINPSYAKKLEEKGDNFKEKNIKTQTISLYILSFITFFNGSLQPESRRLFGDDSLYSMSKFILMIVFLVIVLEPIHNKILKKSTSNGAYIGYSIAVGIALFIILWILIRYIVL